MASVYASLAPGHLQLPGARAFSRADPTPVVIVILDELPAVSIMNHDSRIDEELFPNFARLASTTTWFRNATTVAPLTSDAVPSILTGVSPARLSMLLHGPVPQSIFTLLEESHDVVTSRAFPTVCHLELCPPRGGTEGSLPPPLDVFSSNTRGAALLHFFAEIERVDDPCLCVFHLVMPHSPWRYLPTGQLYPGTRPLPGHIETPGPGRKWRGDRWLVRLSHHRHMLQVTFSDRILGVLVQKLRQQELFDEAIVVVMADHGIAFTPEYPKRAATRLTAGDVAHVPLFVKLPGQQEPEVVDDPVEVIDVVPTIARTLGLTGQLDVDGISLFEPMTDRTRLMGTEELRPTGSDLDRALARKNRKFSFVERWQDLFRLAPRGTQRFVGRVVGDVVEDPAAAVSVTDLADLESARADDRLIPALVKGSVVGEAAAAADLLALAIDDRVEAVTRPYVGDDGQRRFYALLSPEVFRGPPHTLRVFRIEPNASLVALPVTGS